MIAEELRTVRHRSAAAHHSRPPALRRCSAPLRSAGGYLAIARALLAAGAAPDVANQKRETPEGLAEARGAVQLVLLLREARQAAD